MDIETTGTNPKKDKILQIAIIITDWKMNVLFEKEYVVKHNKTRVYKKADEYVQEMHTKTGLWERLETEGLKLSVIDKEISEMIKKHLYTKYKVSIAGNSVHFDNGFIQKQMRKTRKLLSHRVLDVSAILLGMRIIGKKVIIIAICKILSFLGFVPVVSISTHTGHNKQQRIKQWIIMSFKI